ncbi:hypothetical protein JMJ56_14075 [Belnapia sp. T18]|uniref:Heme exporter protein D n=1 Tax=Belnapia arida TaxID=2804533 RepID=A0ABS1U389_9PROT|nr:hypothetical protein [Belnapia arida]MBL6079141.1 hypothetical protein [Belnapia arida]
MAALLHLFTYGIATYFALILVYLGYCLVRDRNRQHGRDAYAARAGASRAKAARRRPASSGEWAAGF